MTTELQEKKEIKKVQKNKTVTLCLIVKNETHIVKECLESMLPYIDRYDITDTGSTDGTPEMIKEFMDQYDVPGEVYLSDWKGFGKSRTEALKNCDGKADYAWMIDADDKIEGSFNYPILGDQDAIAIRLGRPDFSWFRNQIFKTGLGWEYVGVLHEYANLPDKKPQELKIMKWGAEGGNYYVTARTLGARNVGIEPKEKYTRDAETLLSALQNEEDPYYDPTNVRYQFYLAQSYFDSQQWDKSFEAYEKRIELGEWEEEIFFSYYRLGVIKAMQQKPWPEVKEAFLEAWNFRPIRAEPLYEISRMYRSLDKPRLAYIYAKMGIEIPYPEMDILFIAQDVYGWKMLDEFSAVAFYNNDFINGYAVTKKLVDDNKFEESHKERIYENMKAYESKMAEIQHQHQMQQEQQQMMEKHKELENKLKKREEKKKKASGGAKPKKSTKTTTQKSKYKKKKKK